MYLRKHTSMLNLFLGSKLCVCVHSLRGSRKLIHSTTGRARDGLGCLDAHSLLFSRLSFMPHQHDGRATIISTYSMSITASKTYICILSVIIGSICLQDLASCLPACLRLKNLLGVWSVENMVWIDNIIVVIVKGDVSCAYYIQQHSRSIIV